MNTKHYNTYTIFTIIFLVKLTFIFQGINLTDEGYHLTQQVAAYADKVELKDVTTAFFLTQYVGGAWLSIWNAPNLLWARLGGVLIYALNAALIFQLLSGYFDRKKTFYAVTVTALFITSYEFNTIMHYFTFPALLLNTWLLTLSKLTKSKEESTAFKVYGALLGFLIIPIILSRLSLILILLLPAIIFAYQRITKTENIRLNKSLPYAMAGLIASIAAFTLLYAQLGILEYYMQNTQETLRSSATNTKNAGEIGEHGTSELIACYISAGVLGLGETIIVLVAVFCISDSIALIGKKKTMLIIGAIALILLTALKDELLLIHHSAGILNDGAYIMLLLASALFLYVDRRKDKDRTLLMLAGAYILFITPLGSEVGLIKSVHGMWLLMPLLILRTYETAEKTKDVRIKTLRPTLDVFLTIIVIASIIFQAVNIYTDDVNRLNLNTEFKYPALKNIHSLQWRVKAIDEALYKIDEYTEKGDRTLMVSSIPLFYYLTETKPAGGDSWPVFRPIEKIQEDNEKMIAEGNYPKLFVHLKTEPQESNWSTVKSFEYFKKEYTENLNYTLLWENNAFMIYGRREKYR